MSLLLIQAFEWAQDMPNELKRLEKAFLWSLASNRKGPSTGGAGAAASKLLKVVWAKAGMDASRELFDKLQKLPPAGGDMFRTMVELEKQGVVDVEALPASEEGVTSSKRRRIASAKSGATLATRPCEQVRIIYEAAVASYGAEDHLLWLEYAASQDVTTAGAIYWRAVKALHNPDVFIAAYKEQLAG